MPIVRLEVVKLVVVVLPVVLRVPWPMLVPPSEKITTPLGLPCPLLVTVAVKVRLCPQTAGLEADTRVVAELALATVWVMAVAALLLKLPSPL